MRPTFTGSILLAKILFINSIILQSLRQTMCSRSFSFYFLGPVFVVQQLGRLSNWKKKSFQIFLFFFFLECTQPGIISRTSLVCLSLQFLSWEEGFSLDLISLFLPLQKSWLSSSKKNKHILNLIGMPAVSREKEKEGKIYIYSMMESSHFRDF